ncbi:MAG: amino acid permease [Caulobacter sp.]|nr:amino acid permease [Caulobacter sp.]
MGALGATILCAGNMIGSGVYLLPTALGAVGSITVLSWVIASAGALVLALVFGFLGVLRPNADGVVSYASQALHPALGHLGWFTYWLSCWVGIPAVVVSATGYLGFFFPVLREPMAAMICNVSLIWLCVLVCIAGPRTVARLSGATLLIGLVPIVVATVVGFIAFNPHVFAASWNVSGKPPAAAALGAVAPIFFAFLGLESANIAAATIDNPRRNLPIAAVGGVLLAAIVYIAASVAVMGLAPAATLAASSAPFADAIQPVAGAIAAGLVAFCACAKALGALGGWSLVTAEAGRSAAAAGFLPRIVSVISPDRRPVRDLLFAGALMTLAAVVTASPTVGGQFALLVNATVLLCMVIYLLGSASLLRFSAEIQRPGLRLAARIAAVAGCAFSVWIMVILDPSVRLPGVAAVALSLVLYAISRFTARRRAATA